MNGRINADLIHLALLQQEQILVEIEIAQIVNRRRRRRRPRRYWVRPWLSADRRLQFGQYDTLMRELRMDDTNSFFIFLRMEPAMFDELLERVGPRIQKKDTGWRKALEPGIKLAITIRHLASGDKYSSLLYNFRFA
jgi:hypothetical protein